MATLKNVVDRLKSAALALQVFFVVLTFALMVISSYFFVSGIERQHLANDSRNALAYVQALIEADMNRAGTMANGLAQNVRGMIMRGADLNTVQQYFKEMDDYAYSVGMKSFSGFFGYFEAFGNIDIDGTGRYLPEGAVASERPWFIAADSMKGKLAVTEPYTSLNTNQVVVTYARRIYDNHGRPLGITGMNITLERIAKHLGTIPEIAHSEGTYGVLQDKNAVIIVHSDKELLGRKMNEINSSVAELEKELLFHGEVDEREAFNYKGDKIIVFIKSMDNGWKISALTLKDVYYKNLWNMALFLSALGTLLAALLSFLLLRASKAKRKADEFTRVMFKAMPLACHMWNENLQSVMCNDEAMRVYRAADKKYFLNNFFDFSPERQPDGRPSIEKGREYLRKGFAEGYYRFEWIHRRGDGQEFPCEITMIRAMFSGKPALLTYTRDLSEEKAAIEKLRKADEFTDVMFRAMPLACHMWTREMRTVMCNDEAMRMYGAADKQYFLDNFFVDFSPEFQPDGKSSAAKGLEHMQIAFDAGYLRFEWVHRRGKGGEEFPCEIIAIRAMHNGEPVLLSYTRDLSAEKAALEKLREADERIKAIFDATPLAITLWDPANHALIDCNQEAVRVVGMADKELYMKTFAEMSPEYQPNGQKTADMFLDIFEKVKNGDVYRYTWEQKSVDGEVIPFQCNTVRLKYLDSYTVISYAHDMREINAAIASMREADERAQIMVDATPISCTLFDDHFNTIDCNREALKILGLSEKSEYIGKMYKFSPEYQPDGALSSERFLEVTRRALEDGYNRFEWTHMDVNGEPVPCEVTLVRVKHRGKRVLAGYARDLREVKAMFKEMHRAEIAEESNMAKSKFLAAMSHEIRTPMNVILGVTEIQLQDETLSPHVREAFVQVYNSSDLLLGIINDILDLSKIEAEKMEFSPSVYELASLINDTAHLNMMRNSKPITFELSVDPDAPSNLYGDELRIKQILNNLLSNSFKFTEEGRINLRVSVEESGDGGDDVALILTVSDTGQGMSKEQLDLLFTEYTRFNLEANRTIQGTGLGMSITQRLVKMMGGRIDVESTVGGGTTTTVRLPQKRSGDKRIGGELAENLSKFRVDTSLSVKRGQVTREYMPYGKVLIVDDVESNLYVAKGLMAPYGLIIDTAGNGFEAVDKIRDGAKYDVIFMDHMMPKMDGIEATKLIRGHGYDMPIVALTANAVVGQAEMFLKSGFDDFISKPIDIRQLNAALNRLIRDRQPPEVVEKARRERDAASRTLAPPSADSAAPELLAVFSRDALRAMPILESAAANATKLSSDDLQLFTTNVHGLKAALANIGEKRLSQTALALENAGKIGDLGVITLQTGNFIKALNKIVKKAEAEYNRAMDGAAERDENPELLREQMAAIAKACRDYDESTVLNALENLKRMSWTRETGEVLMKISELLLHSDFDEAAAVAEKFV